MYQLTHLPPLPPYNRRRPSAPLPLLGLGTPHRPPTHAARPARLLPRDVQRPVLRAVAAGALDPELLRLVRPHGARFPPACVRVGRWPPSPGKRESRGPRWRRRVAASGVRPADRPHYRDLHVRGVLVGPGCRERGAETGLAGGALRWLSGAR